MVDLSHETISRLFFEQIRNLSIGKRKDFNALFHSRVG